MIGLAVALLLAGAPKTPYGGMATLVVVAPRIETDPWSASTLADLTALLALYEPLYRAGEGGALTPVLAADLPTVEAGGQRFVIHLRPNVPLHDGRPLSPSDAAASLERLAAPGSLGAYIAAPIRKVSAAGGDALAIELLEPYPEFPRLLASPRAGVVASSEARARLVGSGPFAFPARPALDGRGPAEELILEPFLRHPSGRPYLDALRFRLQPTALGAPERLKSGEATLVFAGAPIEAEDAVPIRPPERGPLELVVLALGHGAASLKEEPWYSRLDATLDRRRLAQRFLAGDARAARSLLGEPGAPSPPLVAGSGRVRMTLLCSPERGVDARFAERVQLDLLKAGVTAVIERVGAEALQRARASGDFDLLLDTLVLEGQPKGDAADRLHTLWSVAAHFGRAKELLEPGELAAFGASSEAARARALGPIEARFERAAGLLAIAARAPTSLVRRSLAGVRADRSGALVLEDAYLGPSLEGSR
jgi:MarR-like DNA-binding transcriptional regulator SgrR of sgrS sRNA